MPALVKYAVSTAGVTPRLPFPNWGGEGLTVLREPAYADERSHGWRSEVGVE
jgi:hypothetical protein